MTLGLAATNLANAWLNTLRGGGAGTSYTAPAALYIKLHTGDPGAAATSNASQHTTRQAITFGAAAANSTVQQIAISNTPSWTIASLTSPTTETISHISMWDNVSAGNFLWSILLGTSKAVVNTDVLNLTTCTLSLTPIAA